MKYLLTSLLALFSLSLGFTQCAIFGPTELASGQTVTLSIPATQGQCSECYDWDIIQGSGSILGSDTGNSVTVRKNASGTFTVRVTALNEDGCTSCQIIMTDPGACNQYSVTMNNFSLPSNNSVLLFATTTPSSLTGAAYTWRVFYGDGSQQQFTSSTRYVDVPLFAGQSIVSTRVTVSFQGCVFSDEVTFVPPIEGGTSLSGLADRELPPSNLELQEVKAYPNPTTGELNFMGLPITGHTVSINDYQLKAIVLDSPVDQSLSIRDYPSGIYHFIIQNAEGIVKSGRIIKE